MTFELSSSQVYQARWNTQYQAASFSTVDELVALVIDDAEKINAWGDWFSAYRNRYSLGDGGWYDKRAVTL